MKKSDAVKHFGSEEALQEALGISRQAIEKWGEVIPLTSAVPLEALTRGKLRVNMSMYEKGRPKKVEV